MDNILVSITTVTFNSEKTIRDTIESVLNQTYSNIEYIIVDGLSKDNTVGIAEEYRQAFADKGISYRIISEKDDGMYDAINKGIDMCIGEIIGNVNSDDWYEPDAIEKVVEFYKKTKFDLMYADLRMVYADGRTRIKRSKKGTLATSRHWNHPTQFGTRELYLKNKYKLESLHDDFDLLLRIKKGGYKIEILNEILSNFRMEGMSHDKSIKKSIMRGKARYRIYRNNRYSPLYMIECIAIEVAKFILG